MIYLAAYALFCVAFAKLNQVLIDKGKRIYHGLNGLIHCISAMVGWYFFGWQIGVAVLFVARLVFDTSLNLWRGLPVDYVSTAPKSIIDKLEKRVFKMNGYLPKILYALIIVILLTV